MIPRPSALSRRLSGTRRGRQAAFGFGGRTALGALCVLGVAAGTFSATNQHLAPAALAAPERTPAPAAAVNAAGTAGSAGSAGAAPQGGAAVVSTEAQAVPQAAAARPAVAAAVVNAATMVQAAASTSPAGTRTTRSDGSVQDLSERANEMQTRFVEAAMQYASAQESARQARAAAEESTRAAAAAREAEQAARHLLGEYASTLYRGGPLASGSDSTNALLLVMSGPDNLNEAMHNGALLQQATKGQRVRAERAEQAKAAAAQAEQDAATAQQRAEEAERAASALLDEIQQQAADLSAELNQSLSALGSSVAANAQQKARNEAALGQWNAYLDSLRTAKVVPPAAADLADPANLPAGLVPALNADGSAAPGVATLAAGGAPVTVLPRETVSAISAAFARVGKPYLDGTAGPDTFDCGGLTSAVWGQSGLSLARTPAEQWARGAAIAKDQARMGDLVFAADRRAGLHNVGIYLGGGLMLSASADKYTVGVQQAEDLYSAVRVTLPAPAVDNPAAPASGGVKMTCGAVDRPVSKTSGAGAWGGHSNGLIPDSALCSLGFGGHRLRCDAAGAFQAMAAAYQADTGKTLVITDSYRSLDGQIDVFRRKPGLAAIPGTSNHGWGLAVDLGGGVETFGTPAHRWMQANAGRFGFMHPAWAGSAGSRPEAWHWEFAGAA